MRSQYTACNRCLFNEQGSILLYILLGIVLLGALTIALRNTSGGGTSNIDKEDLILKSNQVQKTASEYAAAVSDLLSNGLSESDIRFAHPDAATEYGVITTNPTNQIFGKTGAKATYRSPPEGINDGSKWEFFATTRVPQIGSDKVELIAVVPNVTKSFCDTINSQLGLKVTTQPTDNASGSTPDCVAGGASDRFTGSFNDISPNLMDETTFSSLPASQACVYCASSSTYNYYYVLLSR